MNNYLTNGYLQIKRNPSDQAPAATSMRRQWAVPIAVVLSLIFSTAFSAEEIPKSIVAVVGDADTFNIGQEDYCGTRTEIASPSGKQVKVQSGKTTFFHIQAKFRTPSATYTCEGEFSFMPAPALLHVVRYTLNGSQCKLEMFQSEPGGTPTRMEFNQEQSRSCLFK